MVKMTNRERFRAITNFEPFDRLPVVEWAPWWDKTIERWKTEGLPNDLNWWDINKYLDLDIYVPYYLQMAYENCPSASEGDALCKNMDDYINLFPYLYPKIQKIDEFWKIWGQSNQNGETVIWFCVNGFFWWARILMGIERHLYAFYDHSELMHRINNDLSSWLLETFKVLIPKHKPDFVLISEDMSYNNGPMISKPVFDEFMKPHYQKVIPILKENGVKVILDSDGKITDPASWFNEAGLDGMLPLERQAGVDIALLRGKYPKMLFIGAFDKMTMSRGEAEMRKEFERLLPVAKTGGYIIGCDHQTPPGVSFENYKIYLKLFREYAVKAAQ